MFVDGREISSGGLDVGSGGVFSHFLRLLHWLGFIIVAGDISGLWRRLRHWLCCGINVMVYLMWRHRPRMASFNGTSIDLFLFCQHWLCSCALILSVLGPFVSDHEISSGGLDIGFGGVFSHCRRHWLCFSSLLSTKSVAFGGAFCLIFIPRCRQWQ